MLQKRALQMSITIAALLPVVSGLWGIAHGVLGAPSDSSWADNHYRYLSGLLLAIGLGYWSTVPRIEAMGARLRLLTALVVIGGGARLVGLALGDAATAEIWTALAMELLVAPLLCLWQTRVRLWQRRDLSTAGANSSGIAKLAPHLRHIAP
jgi:hypothetical protein